MLLLDFSLSTMISDALTILGSIITFITGNALLVGLLGLLVAVPLVFSIIGYIRSKV